VAGSSGWREIPERSFCTANPPASSTGCALGSQILVTLEEALIGFLIGTALGIVSGLALGRVRFLAEVFGPFIKVLNSIPRIVLGSVFVLAFGLGLESKVLLVIVLVFFGVFFNAFQGAREVDRNFVANAAILGASKWQVTRQVVLPSAFTWIIASLHVAFGFALIGAIVGEFMSSSEGLGHAIFKAGSLYIIPKVFAALVATIALALLLTFAVGRIERLLMPWRRIQ
jgi:NitT/TauT family transport system permease protein